jgi:hypothetical protein
MNQDLNVIVEIHMVRMVRPKAKEKTVIKHVQETSMIFVAVYS